MAGQWSIDFLTPLLANENFNTDRTLIIRTFDKCENYLPQNSILRPFCSEALCPLIHWYDEIHKLQSIQPRQDCGGSLGPWGAWERTMSVRLLSSETAVSHRRSCRLGMECPDISSRRWQIEQANAGLDKTNWNWFEYSA